MTDLHAIVSDLRFCTRWPRVWQLADALDAAIDRLTCPHCTLNLTDDPKENET